MKKELNRFGINDLSSVKFVSDRGPNFVKALKNYSSYFCFAHRLNNILVLCFYQNESIKAQTSSSSNTTDGNVLDSEDLFNLSAEIDGIDEVVFIDLSKKKVADLPNCAREVLKVLNNCKDIVKYVKLVSEHTNNYALILVNLENGLNKDIQSEGGISLCQSSKVRWLSIMELLGSIDRSFKETKKGFQEKKKSFAIDRLIIKRLLRLLHPLKHIMTIVQKGNEPSLYLVLICHMTLRKALSSYDNLVQFHKDNNDSSTERKSNDDDDQYDLDSEESDGKLVSSVVMGDECLDNH